MGQRSQIYIRYEDRGYKALIANYYQWNYGERMISRARYGIEMLADIISSKRTCSEYHSKIEHYFDVNFDMGDIAVHCDILKEYLLLSNNNELLNDFIFSYDNNDGKLLLDVSDDGIKYAFLDCDNSINNIMAANDYMQWDCGENWKEPTKYFDNEDIKTCLNNINIIQNNATLMTAEEITDFLNTDYSEFLKEFEEFEFRLTSEYLKNLRKRKRDRDKTTANVK